MTTATMPRRSRFSDEYDPRGRKRLSPKADMNVTPFIDVLLVLLIMLIMAVPIKVHETTIDLPTEPCRTCPMNEDTNTVFITAQDELLWNGVEVTPDQLRRQVAAASAMEEQPELRFEPDALASYDSSARTIALIKEAGAKRFVFVGNARHKQFGSGA
ncbi:ExbD/TolR family protein [Erythrobacter sp. GH1-10]|uniref:ExbD/TolR family protein n=1 Tax=Erythrobacter sp. GH1-10 TaxID=3349334 RepID=UPI003877AB91